MKTDNRICVGVITGAFGIKGDVKLKSFTANEEDLMTYGVLEDDTGLKKFDIQIIGSGKNFLRAKIKGINTRNEAEELKGVKLFVLREQLPNLDDEEYYYADLVGMSVFDDKGGLIGKVNAIYDFGAGDVLEINNSDNQNIMVPFTKKAVPVVDVKNRKIVINEIIETEALSEV